LLVPITLRRNRKKVNGDKVEMEWVINISYLGCVKALDVFGRFFRITRQPRLSRL